MVTVFARSEVTNIADTAPAGTAGRFCFIRSSLQQKALARLERGTGSRAKLAARLVIDHV